MGQWRKVHGLCNGMCGCGVNLIGKQKEDAASSYGDLVLVFDKQREIKDCLVLVSEKPRMVLVSEKQRMVVAIYFDLKIAVYQDIFKRIARKLFWLIYQASNCTGYSNLIFAGSPHN